MTKYYLDPLTNIIPFFKLLEYQIWIEILDTTIYEYIYSSRPDQGPPALVEADLLHSMPNVQLGLVPGVWVQESSNGTWSKCLVAEQCLVVAHCLWVVLYIVEICYLVTVPGGLLVPGENLIPGYNS